MDAEERQRLEEQRSAARVRMKELHPQICQLNELLVKLNKAYLHARLRYIQADEALASVRVIPSNVSGKKKSDDLDSILGGMTKEQLDNLINKLTEDSK